MDKNAGTRIKLFPNPVTTNCFVTYPTATANASLSILQMDGKKVGDYKIANGSTQRSIDVSELRSGYYFIVYKNENLTTTSTFIK
jgi:hypothetical protein